MANRLKFWLILLTHFVAVGTIGCNIDRTGKDLRIFNDEFRKAEVALIESDFENAEIHCNRASDIGEKMKWSDGIVMAKRKCADVSASRGDLLDARIRYEKVRDLCISLDDCSPGQLASSTDKLVELNSSKLRNPTRVLEIVNDTIRYRSRLEPDEKVSSIIRNYCTLLTTFGFQVEAANCWDLQKQLE